LEFDDILKIVSDKYSVESDSENKIIRLTPENMLDVCGHLFDDPSLLFDYLMCITSIDNQENGLELAYNLYSYKNRHYLELRIVIQDNKAVPSVESIWKTADWHEREAYDMMGIEFSGHPNLTRILLPEDWEGFPLRKDYEESDYYHGMPIPKDKTEWE
tara:strand:- start:257 stop:733 length:477 start_codon:yes stop_codon:yes gene_type:complete